MAAEDYFPLWGDPFDKDEEPPTCRYCGEAFEWGQVNGRWVPHVDGFPHQCAERFTAGADEFPDES